MLDCELSKYGYSVTKDIIQHDKKHVEMYSLKYNLDKLREQWKEAFMHEMRLLLGLYMPQDLPNNKLCPYVKMQQAQDHGMELM